MDSELLAGWSVDSGEEGEAMIKTGDRVTWEEKVHPGKGNKTPWYKATFIGTVKFYGPARCQVITDSGEERYPLTSKLKGTRA